MLSVVNIVLVIVALPAAFLYLYFNDLETVQSPDFQDRFSPLTDGIKTSSRVYLSFFPAFILRRFLFGCLYLLASSTDQCYIQISALIYLNHGNAIYIGFLKPYKSQLDNQINIVNELLIGWFTITMLANTQWVDDQQAKYQFAWVQCLLIEIVVAYNMYYFVRFGARSLNMLF